ncbi:MAG: hypothetical protein HOM68_26470 [Gemmatimonadetes bacterium]|jgi:sulfofructose kinase|nr:hypothetical protein [Gemmatimonadota bacterium]MBT5060115.1 hypothetical protein [Gemmatimonadota bacterium]MBT5144218.1 hypothetical protein [Gemmatimonadota bacterium]MBT5588756.1 hypothetical protein [Gemmatimonadota bacterium]MBT5964526.1 hypothetical protein [Gemmatimonadota bacterium]
MSAPSPATVVGVGLMNVDELFLVDSLPVLGGSRKAIAHSRQCGGPAPTAMACLARFGVSTRILARIGSDANADFLCNQMARLGVGIDFIQRDSGACRVTGVFVDAASGDRGFLATPQDVADLTATDINPQAMAGAQVVLVDDADEAGIAAARYAREAGQRVVFDGTWQSEKLDEFLPLVDVAIVSEFFARRWMPEAPDEEIVGELLARGVETAVLTLGALGSITATPSGGLLKTPAFPVDVLDTTGAGDAFHGGYIYGMLQSWPLPEVLRFASAAGALNCRQLGGQGGLPSLVEVQNLLTTHENLVSVVG